MQAAAEITLLEQYLALVHQRFCAVLHEQVTFWCSQHAKLRQAFEPARKIENFLLEHLSSKVCHSVAKLAQVCTI